MNAYEQGLEWGSCKEALEMRKNYANQPDWWKACDRGDWLLWQLAHLSEEMYEKLQSQIQIAVDIIVARAVTNHTLHCGIPKVEIWAKNWLNGTDRSWGAAWDAVGAAARDAAGDWQGQRILDYAHGRAQ